jgi:hypothetical protein
MQVKFHFKANNYYYVGNEVNVDFEGAKNSGFETILIDFSNEMKLNKWIDKKFTKLTKITFNE